MMISASAAVLSSIFFIFILPFSLALSIELIRLVVVVEKGISVEVDANFVKRVGEREVPHGSVPIFRSRSITTRVILPENTPVMIGGFSDNGRRALIICQAKITNNKEAQP